MSSEPMDYETAATITAKTGTVRDFDKKKGFGFITVDDTGKNVFVHFSNIIARKEGEFRLLHSGDRVQFNVRAGRKGPEAYNVQKIEG